VLDSEKLCLEVVAQFVTQKEVIVSSDRNAVVTLPRRVI